ncbi:MAG TPA: DUF4349 domain-containing protein [Thermoleophilaceae bacterium]|nr:DUF4349 domain-containing protein [Thermoleophilaceae bacterium]
MTQPDRDLAVIDVALEQGRATAPDAAERELQELALALRADSAEPRPAFADELGERVRAGFPRTAPARRARSLAGRLRLPRRLLPVMAAAATVLIALAVAVPLLGGGEDATIGGTEPQLRGGRDSGAPPAAESRSDMTQAPPPVPPTGGSGQGFDPGRGRRSIERSASLSLEAPADDLDQVAEGVARVADRQRGFVLRSSVSSGEAAAGGSLDLRVPADRLRDTLRDLSALGKVRSRSESGQDVTGAVVGASDRLDSARAERASLLRRLRRAGSDTQAEALRRRLDANAIEVRRLRSDLRSLRLRTNYAAITVGLSDGSQGGALGGPEDTTQDALDDAVASLQASLNFMLRALGALLPLALVLAALWYGARGLMRRRRESALA